jgi:hypothetical protein
MCCHVIVGGVGLQDVEWNVLDLELVGPVHRTQSMS